MHIMLTLHITIYARCQLIQHMQLLTNQTLRLLSYISLRMRLVIVYHVNAYISIKPRPVASRESVSKRICLIV